MNPTQTIPWDVSEHLQSKEDIAAYLEAAIAEGDPELLVVVFKDVARCQIIQQLVEQSNDDSIYQALSNENNPSFSTVLKLLQVFGLRLQATVI